MLENDLYKYMKQTQTKSENSYIQEQVWMFCEKLTLSEKNSGFTMNSFLGKLDCYAAPGAARKWWLAERDYYAGSKLTAVYSTSVQQCN